MIIDIDIYCEGNSLWARPQIRTMSKSTRSKDAALFSETAPLLQAVFDFTAPRARAAAPFESNNNK